MRDFIKALIEDFYVEIISVVVFLVVLFSLSFALAANSCRITAGYMEVNYEYSIVAGCMIEIEDGKYIPLKSYYYKEEK